MKTLASLGVVILVVVMAVSVAPASGVAQASAPFKVSVDRTTLRSGQTLTATGRADRLCAWIIDWNNERRSASARRIVATFVAPQVETRTRIPLRGTCFYASTPPRPVPAPTPTPSRSGSTAQRVTVVVPKSFNEVLTITVLPAHSVSPPGPDDDGGSGGLPGTGGPDLWILLAGLATLLVGASLIKFAAPEDAPFEPVSR